MDPVVDRLTQAMTRECTLLAAFHDAENTMRGRIQCKDWDGLELVMDEMTELADDLVTTEGDRHAEFEKLRTSVKESGEASFYQVVVHLPRTEREQLSDLYRLMKSSVFGIQAEGYCMDQEVRNVNDTMHSILGELYPHRKGNIYSKQGAKTQTGANPVLFDHEL